MVTFISNRKMPDATPWHFSFNDVSDDEQIIDDSDNDVVDDPIEFQNEDEQEEEEDLIVDPYYFCVHE